MIQPTKVQRLQSPHKSTAQSHRIKFNLDQSYLSCFISKRPLQLKSRDKKPSNHYHRPQLKMPKDILQKQISSYNAPTSPYFDRHFNHKVLFTHYGQDQVYVDSQTTPDTVSSQVASEEEQTKQQQQILAQCIRVITEETSDKISEPQVYLNPQEPINIFASQKFINSPMQEAPEIKSSYGSKDLQFQIKLKNIERDGRTTIMLRNIPNKYTQQMILAEIDENGLFRKYNFFYLPIDYKNDCNVGYAFINLIDTQFIHRLYQEFNGKKWRRFNSQKICQVCYARLQGTGQLMNHFRYSNVLHQRDWKFKPLIYLNLETRLDNIQDIVQRQQSERN